MGSALDRLYEIAAIMLVVTALVIYLLMRVYSRHTVYADSEKPLWKKCEPCEGCGVVMLGGRPIPVENRSFYRTVSNTAKRHGVFQGPVANVVTCRWCLGLGSSWTYKNTPRNGLPTVPLFTSNPDSNGE